MEQPPGYRELRQEPGRDCLKCAESDGRDEKGGRDVVRMLRGKDV